MDKEINDFLEDESDNNTSYLAQLSQNEYKAEVSNNELAETSEYLAQIQDNVSESKPTTELQEKEENIINILSKSQEAYNVGPRSGLSIIAELEAANEIAMMDPDNTAEENNELTDNLDELLKSQNDYIIYIYITSE